MVDNEEAKGKAADKLDQILGGLTNLSADMQDLQRRLGDVETRVKQQDMRTAKFQPMQPPEGLGKKPMPRLEGLQKAEQFATEGKSLMVSASGLIAPYARRLYPDGAIVRVNPTSDLYRRLQLAKEKAEKAGRDRFFDPDRGEGVVITTHFVNSRWQVKYRVRFDGLTQQGRGDGFYEDELIPA